MCGRYTAYEDEDTEIRSIYDAVRSAYDGINLKSGEIFPSDTVPLLRGKELEPFPAKWGFDGYSGKGLIINARSETVTEKSSFRSLTAHGRCAVPTTGYFEWSPDKKKYIFYMPRKRTVYLAGLYRPSESGIKFVILTTKALPSLSHIHPRMPVILGSDTLPLWLSDTQDASEVFTSKMPVLLYDEA